MDDAQAKRRMLNLMKDIERTGTETDVFRHACRKLAVLSWHFLTPNKRHEFLGRCDPVDLAFDMEPISDKAILANWHVVMENLPDGWDGEFAQSVDKKRKVKWFKPTGNQLMNIRRIWADAMEARDEPEQDLGVLEDSE